MLALFCTNYSFVLVSQHANPVHFSSYRKYSIIKSILVDASQSLHSFRDLLRRHYQISVILSVEKFRTVVDDLWRHHEHLGATSAKLITRTLALQEGWSCRLRDYQADRLTGLKKNRYYIEGQWHSGRARPRTYRGHFFFSEEVAHQTSSQWLQPNSHRGGRYGI